ncbi:MAG: hypothetical protein JSS78_02965 [Bacteroidetes bacterium]|nr:hypothetical protein [Bacteroidota bacterium]
MIKMLLQQPLPNKETTQKEIGNSGGSLQSLTKQMSEHLQTAAIDLLQPRQQTIDAILKIAKSTLSR